MKNNTPTDRLLNICTWCNQVIQEDDEVFGFGAKASHGIVLSDKEGECVSLKFALLDKTVFALVPSKTSTAVTDGYDLIFITCSEECAQSVKDALELEKDVFETD